MTTLSRTLRMAAVLAAAMLALVPTNVAAAGPAAAFRVLVFSKTTGFRHDSIPAGIAAIQQLGRQNDFTVDATEDDTRFTDANLAQYGAVIFLSATGDPLGSQAEKDAFQRYIQRGGGFVGIHAASDSGYSWPWYGQLVGTYFRQHPAQQNALLRIADPNHPSTQGLPAQFTRFDEWYDFQTNPRPNVHVLTTVDESSYSGGTMGADHPTTWCHNFDGGRAWYTALGHTAQSFTEANFLRLLLGGIQTVAGVVPADCAVSTPPPPTVISLRAHANGRFVSADNAGAGPLIAKATAIGPWEQFDRLDAGNGNIALRAHANNRIVAAENAGNNPLIANRTAVGLWETFQLIRNPDGSVSLRALVNGRLVTAENAGNSALIANRTAVGAWEEFDLVG
ncbi:ThuA domain-containing protein [Actinophytocola sp.]|uniref:ThuA domain-containing protein n=1 Tax=Actinophytocola sp. TaxID=1872138 RepID=UPI002D8016B7|nr:ThuA domain-containing protein [Actinophytocola sp.]HET9137913.1 ThuA domain-containing protein [Actinophytocola sp.]